MSVLVTKLGRLPIFSNTSLSEPGWYWFEPTHPSAGGIPGFMRIDDDTIKDGALNCRRYAGQYAGPIQPPDMIIFDGVNKTLFIRYFTHRDDIVPADSARIAEVTHLRSNILDELAVYAGLIAWMEKNPKGKVDFIFD